jgi:hypothetical protein
MVSIDGANLSATYPGLYNVGLAHFLLGTDCAFCELFCAVYVCECKFYNNGIDTYLNGYSMIEDSYKA